MKPSLGRIVIYHDKSQSFNGQYFAPAVITRVWSDTCVNLIVLADCTNPFVKTSVVLDPEKVQDIGWSWPERV